MGGSGRPRWAEEAIGQALLDRAAQRTLKRARAGNIPRVATFLDPSGVLATLQPGGPTPTAGSPFFQPLGSNGRTCQTCHQPAAAWTITPPQIAGRVLTSGGTAPLFRPVDGAVCPNADVSSIESRITAYSLVLRKGLIRGLAAIAGPADASVQHHRGTGPIQLHDGSAFGLTSYGPTQQSQGMVSVYRRPLPSTNLPFPDHHHVGWARAEP